MSARSGRGVLGVGRQDQGISQRGYMHLCNLTGRKDGYLFFQMRLASEQRQ